ncbi:MAG: LuxR C-terminal-related transcriptional regulator [Thermomicrobiales bacterium]
MRSRARISGVNLMALGQMLRSHRIVAGLSQESLAQRSGVSVRTISDLERGHRSAAHLETARHLADALGLTTDDRRQFLEASSTGSDRADPGNDDLVDPPESPRRLNVPTPLNELIGRENLVDDLIALLNAGATRLITLMGPGGVGKTRLAIEVASRVGEQFAGGAWFVSLAQVSDACLVHDAIAQTMGVRASGELLVLDRIAAQLSSRRALMVLDNFEHVVDAAPVVSTLLANCPGLTVMATSRAALNLTGEQRFPIPPLELLNPSRVRSASDIATVEAVRLFSIRARAALPEFVLADPDASAVAEICNRLDGLPLAIELAAARSAVLGPQALLAKLSPTLDVLTGGPRDHPDRLKTMRAAISWSYDLLSPSDQLFFRRLSVFVGGFTLEAAEAMVGSQTRVLDGISTLLASSLVDRRIQPDGQPRYSMLETIREVGLEQLNDAGETGETRRRHANYFAALGVGGYPNEVGPFTGIADRFSQLEDEQANVRAAFTAMVEEGDANGVLRLASALSVFWMHRGHLMEAKRWLEWGLAHTADAPTIERGHGLRSLSMVRATLGAHAEALEIAHSALAISEQVDSPKLSALVSHALGVINAYVGRFEGARSHLELAIERWSALGALAEEAMCKQILSGVVRNLGDVDRATALADLALEQFQAIGHTTGAAWCNCQLARIARDGGNDWRARARYQEALRLWTSIEDRFAITAALAGLAELAAAHGQEAAAARILGGIDAVAEEAGTSFLSCHDICRRARSRAVAMLGEAQFAARYAEGRQMPLDGIIGEAAAVNISDMTVRTPLSRRERDVLHLMASGRTNQEIAADLFVGRSTVNTHVSNILSKLNASNRRAAVSTAREIGLLPRNSG